MVGMVSAVNCWDTTHSISESDCEADAECEWFEDPWGSWCSEKGCWNLFTQTDCNNALSLINKSCNWQSGSTSGWCMEIDCRVFDGTNNETCEGNSYGLRCNWIDTYDESNYNLPCVGPPENECWKYSNSTACTAVAGCVWGMCNRQSCWDQTTQSDCITATGFSGEDCKWNSQYSYCYESGCWDYTNSTSCEANSCAWDGGSCFKQSCYDFGYKNESYCVNNTAGLNCNWNDPWCEEVGCWNYNTENTCNLSNSSTGKNCYWETYTGGWCEEVGCWSYDQTNASACVNNTASLSCTWEDPWCYENISAKGCGDISNERNCMDTFYCWWNNTAETCNDPGGGIETEFIEWNPGCYIFDMAGQTFCENVTGCYWSNGQCETNTSIIAGGQLNCSLITNQTMCNKMPMLSTCCKWQAGSCEADRFTTACLDDMEEPPEGCYYCEDYVAYTNKDKCEQIAGDPWFMPCKWNNDTERCEFKHDNVFTEGRENIALIDNQKNCEAAGGNWVINTYCSSNDADTAVAIPMGRCEFKFDDERNCDKECFACDYKTDKTNWSSVTEAKGACINSVLGICKFTQDSSAPNGYGYCKPKEEFVKGIAMDCDIDCGSCTYMGDPTAAEPEKRPSYFCKNSKAKCKWIPDLDYPTDESRGRCGSKAEKTCEDRCDMCFDETNCLNKGAKKGNTSLATQCSWDGNLYICTPASGGDQMEICWDGIDNNQDGKMDCADSMCWSDPFCGGEFMIGFGGMDCFGYDTQADCEGSGGCVWINENWGSWCDMPGANCWKNDGDQISCEANNNCVWHSGFGGFCEENWTMSDSCMNLEQSKCTTNISCIWVVDDYYNDYGGWCDPDPDYVGDYYDCVQHDIDGSEICEAAGTSDNNGIKPCNWYTSSSGDYAGGWCDHMKFACWQFNNESDCIESTNATYNHSEWCVWKQDEYGSWCEGKMMGGGSGSCWSYSDQNSCNIAGCNWVSGFCDPVGFGSEMGFGMGGGQTMGGFGTSCFKYDGNQSGCETQSGCGWFEEANAFCDVNFESDCPQYSYNGTICNQLDRCKYNPMSGDGETGGFCDEKPFECSWNSSLNDQNTCNTHPMCNWSSSLSSCEPICFNTSVQSVCNSINATGTNTSVCRWINGWCNPGAAAEFFKGMEGGAPIPLGTDSQGDASQAEVDILDFGMKDMGMGKSFGFGIRVSNIENASMCNGIKLSSGKAGTGENTTKFYWYLDTDGDSTGNCAVRHDSTQVGFEFYFKGIWSWDNSTGESVESLEAYRCADNNWIKAAIPLQSINQIACTKIGGGMVAVEKSELEKFPDLYTTGVDMRVTVATANETGNITDPTDTIATTNVGYATPGALDQDLDNLDLYKYKLNVSEKTGGGAGYGYINYGNVDCWNETGCADYQCKGHPYCVENSYGVEAAGFTDTRVPKIVGIIKETYPNSSLITYFTDKPANGTLTLYGPSPTCEEPDTPYNPIHDIGITSSNVREFKLWHVAELNEDTLGSPLANNVTYYYKIKVCDNNNKCGISKCSRLVTEELDSTDCGFCKFVTRIDTPSDWNVSYDLDQDGVYEHLQGSICGSKAGMLTNYSSGRRANIRLTKSDNSTYLEFINVTLTKTGLGTKIRSVSGANAFSSGTTTDSSGNTLGYAGMIEDTRDKIVNNLHPEICYVKIPKGDGDCSELWHCNNDLDKCVNRTAEASLNANGDNYCVWKIPYCEFSTWAGGQPGTTSTSSSSTTSGGGGTTTVDETVSSIIKAVNIKEGETILLSTADKGSFTLKGVKHIIYIKSITEDKVTLTINSDPLVVTLGIADRVEVDVDRNGINDLFIRLDAIVDGKAKLYFREIKEKEVVEGEKLEEEAAPTGKATMPGVAEGIPTKLRWQSILVILAVIICIVGFVYYLKRRS
jgi:hypothetical protein